MHIIANNCRNANDKIMGEKKIYIVIINLQLCISMLKLGKKNKYCLKG